MPDWNLMDSKFIKNVKISSLPESQSQDFFRETSASAVRTAIWTNACITTAKGFAWWMSGSDAMQSEALHSLADTLTQILLAVGLSKSARRPDMKHSYGYPRDRYVFGLMAAFMVFGIGCALSIYQGIVDLYSPRALSHLGINLCVLLVSALMESYSLMVALRVVRRNAAREGLSLLKYILTSSDNMGVAVLLEDFTAILGVASAAFFILLATKTGDSTYDAWGSITIGCLLGIVAVFMISRNRYYLLSPNMPRDLTDRIVSNLKKDKLVKAIHDVKGEVIGDGHMRFKAEIEIDATAFAEKVLAKRGIKGLEAACQTGSSGAIYQEAQLLLASGVNHMGGEINRLEDIVKQTVPAVKHVDLEVH